MTWHKEVTKFTYVLIYYNVNSLNLNITDIMTYLYVIKKGEEFFNARVKCWYCCPSIYDICIAYYITIHYLGRWSGYRIYLIIISIEQSWFGYLLYTVKMVRPYNDFSLLRSKLVRWWVHVMYSSILGTFYVLGFLFWNLMRVWEIK